MTIILFIAVLAILILSHEFGHFLVAKKSGMKVEEFGFGFPPRLFGFKKGETVYSINLIPFGGFVKIFGEDVNEKQPGSFSSRPIYVRSIVIAAGVFFNLLLAWVLFSGAFALGAPSGVPDDIEGVVTILEAQEGTPAQKAGLQLGDQLVRLLSQGDVLEVNSVLEVQNFIDSHRGQKVTIEFRRGRQSLAVQAMPSIEPEVGKGALGIAMDKVGIVSVPIHLAVWEGLKTTVFLVGAIIKAFALIIANLFKGVDLGVQVLGPVGIVGVVGTFSELGLVYLLQFIALFSVNLAIINFIPFPALDGGRLLFLAIEAVKGSPVNQKLVTLANSVGFALLIALMLLVTYKDILRLVG